MGAQAIKARFREKLRKRILWIPTRKLDFSAFRNSYSISTYRTPLRRILGGDRTVGRVNPWGRVQPLPPVVFCLGLWLRQRRRCTLTPRCQPSLTRQSSAGGNFLSVLYWTVHRACQILVAPSENRFDATTAIPANSQKRHLLYFQCGSPQVFPLSGYFCSHLSNRGGIVVLYRALGECLNRRHPVLF